jgi:HAD superfamily hydrolase (TIGR01509 family)
MHIRAVLFDWDGTLTYPGSLDFPAIKRALGCPPHMPILEYLETLTPHHRARSMEILDEEEVKAARASRPNKGAEKCLRDLKERALPLGILTRNSLRSVAEALARFDGLGTEDFAAIITREACRPKPHPDGVLLGARNMGVNPAELMMVGDYRFDVMAGKAAGAVAVLLTNCNPSPMLPGDPGPDHVIESLEELRSLLPLTPPTR